MMYKLVHGMERTDREDAITKEDGKKRGQIQVEENQRSKVREEAQLSKQKLGNVEWFERRGSWGLDESRY